MYILIGFKSLKAFYKLIFSNEIITLTSIHSMECDLILFDVVFLVDTFEKTKNNKVNKQYGKPWTKHRISDIKTTCKTN